MYNLTILILIPNRLTALESVIKLKFWIYLIVLEQKFRIAYT